MDIETIRNRCEETGNLFFHPDTIRYFNCRMGDHVYSGQGGTYFVTSEQCVGLRGEVHPRRYTIRQWVHSQAWVFNRGLFNDIADEYFAEISAERLADTSHQHQLDHLIRSLDRTVCDGRYKSGFCRYGTIADICRGDKVKLGRCDLFAHQQSNGRFKLSFHSWRENYEPDDRALAKASYITHQLCLVLAVYLWEGDTEVGGHDDRV